MAISNDQLEHIRKKVGSCKNCGQENWITSGEVVTFLGFDTKTREVQVGGAIIPAVALTCQACGNILLMNAQVLGLLPQ